MRKKCNDFDAVGVERMTDAELSKKLGSYQRTESISISLGVILVITACISMFIQRDPILVCALAFPGVALFLLVAKPAQTKKKALMQQQLGGFFRTELTKAFGPEPEPTTLPIDRAYLKAAKLSAVDFTECTVTDFHEGEHKGLRVSAVFMGEDSSSRDAERIYGKNLARIRGMDQLARAAGRLIQNEIRELGD